MKNIIKKTILALLILLITLSIALFAYLKSTQPHPEKLPQLQNGDLVFQTIKSSQTLAIALASRSPYTHIGIIKINNQNQPIVVEAVGPVREIPLTQWIKQGFGNRITIKRLKNINESTAQNALKAAKPYYGRPYDFHFLFDKNSIYCSELAYYAFKEGANIDLGQVQKVEQLKMGHASVKKLIAERWENYMPCREKGANSYEACVDVVMQQELITPASIAEDQKLNTIYSNY